MTSSAELPIHPGLYVKKHILPKDMTVTEAARILSVGRPALSNFLNGKASLSQDMALRIEKSFGADKAQLLDLQSAFDSSAHQAKENKIIVASYVPSFLTITAKQIDAWASGLNSRSLLAVLLRKLILSSASIIESIDFPGYDNAERKGWDGTITSTQATPWIAEGLSGWEFGCSTDPTAKAEKDYLARTKSINSRERSRTTFTFVTPRNWPGKTNWQESKRALAEWKNVRVMDASDIEQWLEQSVAAQIWFAEQLGLPVKNFSTLDHWWEKWSLATEPNMSRSLFEPAIDLYKPLFLEWFEKPSKKPFYVAADSKEEGLAFLAAMFAEPDLVSLQVSSTAAVFSDVESLRKLSASSAAFIPIVYANEIEQELFRMCRQRHCISIVPRGSLRRGADITLEKLTEPQLLTGLEAMGIDEEYGKRLTRATGRSLTVLRRRLAILESVQIPAWARDSVHPAAMLPICLIGGWKENSEADREILSLLAHKTYAEIEDDLARFLRLDDAPVWSLESGRGVVSKLDVLYAISDLMTRNHLEDFFILAELVLAEEDPALVLPEKDRWAAGIYGKVRNHSRSLAEALCETLVLLSMHGNSLFLERLGIDVEAKIDTLVRNLLTPFSLEKLQSQDRNLPYLAEAMPDLFLALVEQDLRSSNPAVMELMRPVSSSLFSKCWRTSILWALECIVWNKEYLPRVSLVLAKMAERKLDDNWASKPIETLKSIYRWWFPQTNASTDEKISGLKLIIKRFPEVGWELCLDQIRSDRAALPNYKPLWREHKSQPLDNSRKELIRYRVEALNMALEWKNHTEYTLGDLVARITVMPEQEQTRVWDQIDVWAATAPDQAKATLKERIRLNTFSRRRQRNTADSHDLSRALATCTNLTSENAVIRHKWLFEKAWIEPSYDEIEDIKYDYETTIKKIEEQRKQALSEIWEEQGLSGVIELVNGVEPVHIVASQLYASLHLFLDFTDLSIKMLTLDSFHSDRKRELFLSGLLCSMHINLQRQFFGKAAASGISGELLAKLFTFAPFERDIWTQVLAQPAYVQDEYWKTVQPLWRDYCVSDLALVIDSFIAAGRPRAAFVSASADWDKVETKRMINLLKLLPASVEAGMEDELRVYEISQAFTSLNSRNEINEQELATLEFQFISALTDDAGSGIPNLQRQFSKSAKLFTSVVAMATKRCDDKVDPPGLLIEDPAKQQQAARACLDALDHVKHVPGYDETTDSIVMQSMFDWLLEARSILADLGRIKIGDQFIGKLLARNALTESQFPCEEICEAIETIGSEDIAAGFRIEILNSRGCYWSSGDGLQERELSDKYRRIAQGLAFEYPFVSSILESIALSYDRQAVNEQNEGKLRKQSMN